MDIGHPYQLLGQVDVGLLAMKAAMLRTMDWEARPIRRASLAGTPHNAARSIVMKHEWTPEVSSRGFKTIEESLAFWCEAEGRSSAGMFPISRQANDQTVVYTFEDWFKWRAIVEPICDQVLAMVPNASSPVLTRALLVRLDGKGVVPYHVDGQALAGIAHRIHVCLSHSPGCIYKVGGEHFTMQPGGVYDFNNKWKHGVENRDFAPRINLMLEVLPNAKLVGEVEHLREPSLTP